MPNLYAVGPDGKVAAGCRAVEAVRVIHDLDDLFANLRGARERVSKGIVPSEEFKKGADASPHAKTTARLMAQADTNPVRPAEQRYLQEHGSVAYARLITRLFNELISPE